MEKRVVFALALSLLVLVGYQLMIPKVSPQAPASISQREITHEKLIEQQRPIEVPTEIPEIFTNEKEISFQNKLYDVIFTDVGGGIKKVTLKVNKKCGLNIPYEVFNSTDPRNRLGLFFPDKFGAVLNSIQYDAKITGDTAIFTHKINDEVILEKRYIFSNSLYLIELELTWKNIKNNDIAKKYLLISNIQLPSSLEEEKFVEISVDSDGKISKYKKKSKPFEIQKIGVPNWVMLKSRYFSMILRPFTQSIGYIVKQESNGIVVSAVNIQEFNIPSNSSVIHKFGLYIGPADLNSVKQANIGAENTLTYGFFGSISQLLISGLKFFYSISRNWGIAILLLVLLINIILLPLTKKSYKSMQEMQILQPKIEKLRAEFKSNPQKLQKEIMELYKKYKVNPMGGCLPMLLQMPVFIALYQGLMHSIELRGAKFLWIKDLSTPENIRIPFTLPLIGNSINILPVLMLVAMFFQQRLSNKITSMAQTDEQRQQQKIMSIMMTVMFGFIFYNFPSGLVLYWFGNTVVMTAYQFVFTRAPKPVHLLDT